jgi:hypothetical protein
MEIAMTDREGLSVSQQRSLRRLSFLSPNQASGDDVRG